MAVLSDSVFQGGSGQGVYIQDNVAVDGCGGGMSVADGAVVVDVDVVQNRVMVATTDSSSSSIVGGGGVCLSSGEATLRNVIVESNMASSCSGGGVLVAPHCRLHHAGRVSLNVAAGGGGVSALLNATYAGLDGTVLVTANSADDMTASIPSPAAAGVGGGVLCMSCDRLSHIVVADNVGVFGGGIGVLRDAVDDSIAEVLDSAARNNTAHVAGGGVYVAGTSVTASNLTIAGNIAVHRGGGAALVSAQLVPMPSPLGHSVASVHVVDNVAVDGGGVATSNAAIGMPPSMMLVTDNIAARFGGGVYAHDASTSPASRTPSTLAGVRVQRCHAGDSGGGVYVVRNSVLPPSVWSNTEHAGTDDEVSLRVGPSTTVTSCSAAISGGGIHVQSASATVVDVTVRACSVAGQTGVGGGLSIDAGVVRLTASTIYDCSAARGGGVAVTASHVIGLNASDVDITQCEASVGGGVYVVGGSTSTRPSLVSGLLVASSSAVSGGGAAVAATATATFAGVTFSKCSATSLSAVSTVGVADGCGGGVAILAGGIATLRNSRVQQCTSVLDGGGVHGLGAVVCESTAFLGNVAERSGGAMTVVGTTNATVRECEFGTNTARLSGGALFAADGAEVLITDTVAADNAVVPPVAGTCTSATLCRSQSSHCVSLVWGCLWRAQTPWAAPLLSSPPRRSS